MIDRLDRRRVLAALLGGATAGLAGCGQGDDSTDSGPTTGGDGTPDGDGPATSDGDDGTTTGAQGTGSPGATETTGDGSTATARPQVPDAVGLETIATGLDAPVALAFPPDTDRTYVADQPGRILVHESGGLRDEPLLDLRDAVEFGGEKGLLGIALHPAFPDDRRLFVRYSAPAREGTPSGYSHTFVLASFAVDEGGQSASRASEQAVLEIPEPQPNHNAGSLAFGPDGLLFVGTGDGGGGGDQGNGHVEDWYDAVEGGNGQDVTENLLGSILRIDVDEPRSSARQTTSDDVGGDGTPDADAGVDGAYAIPEDNPLVGEAGLDEQYAWGFRNPWRFSFDGDDLFVADVGQAEWEEVDLVERGGNYGWNVREGTHCYGAESCPSETPESVRGGEPLRAPIVEYPHSGAEVSGNSVIGGVVARSGTVPGLSGRYVFADLSASGELFVASRPDGDGAGADGDGAGADGAESDAEWPTQVVPIVDGDAGKLERVLSLDREPAGDVYVLGTGDVDGGGGVHRVVPA